MDLNSLSSAGGSDRYATMLWFSENFKLAICSASTEPSEKIKEFKQLELIFLKHKLIRIQLNLIQAKNVLI